MQVQSKRIVFGPCSLVPLDDQVFGDAASAGKYPQDSCVLTTMASCYRSRSKGEGTLSLSIEYPESAGCFVSRVVARGSRGFPVLDWAERRCRGSRISINKESEVLANRRQLN